MILAGEPSGDVHGSALVKEIRKREPDAKLSGMGGKHMMSAGVDLFYSIDRLSAMGLTEVLLQMKYIKQAFNEFKAQLKKNKPDLLILVDYPGFNLRAAKFAKENFQIKILYYITPKVWAWNQGRLRKMKSLLDHAALIFPFEEKLYKKAGIPATYVGNPLVDDMTENPSHDPGLHATSECASPGDNQKLRIIGILPGSRKAEIDNLLGIMLRAGHLIHQQDRNTRFLVSCADSVSPEKVKNIIRSFHTGDLFQVVSGHPRKIFAHADLLIAASGTVTLEAALCRIPTLLIYKMSFVSFCLARILVKVKYAGLANIIMDKEVMPELLQQDATPLKIHLRALEMLQNLPEYAGKLDAVRKLLGSPGASKRAAQIALNLVR